MTKMKSLISTLLGVSLFSGFVSYAEDYYVSQLEENASDQNNGAVGQPFKTLQGAFKSIGKKLNPGDIVWVKNGVYREGVSLWPESSPENVGDGLRISAERISIMGFPGQQPVISGSVELRE